MIGLIASFHTIIFAQGRQIYSLSRAGYFPTGLFVTHGLRKTPHVAMITGAVAGLAVMLAVWFGVGSERGSAVIGGTLLNMAVFGAMFSYIMQALSFILLRRNQPDIERPYRSPLGVPGAMATIVIAAVTIYFQLLGPVYRVGVIGVAIWFVVLHPLLRDLCPPPHDPLARRRSSRSRAATPRTRSACAPGIG